MKKIVFIVMCTLIVLSILFTGCINKNEKVPEYDKSLFRMIENEDRYLFYSKEDADGIQFEMTGKLENEIETSEKILSIVKNRASTTYLAFSGKENGIKKENYLFSLKKQDFEIKNIKMIKDTDSVALQRVDGVRSDKLLGDFNTDNTVDIFDFIEFVNHCPSNSGDGVYEEKYDIGPATDANADGIYDLNYPDQYVDIFDFIIFAWNFGKSVENRKPIIEYFEGPEGTVTTNTVNFYFNARDPDGYVDYYKYSKDDLEATTTATGVIWSGYAEGLHHFEVVAVDNDGLESDATACYFYYQPIEDAKQYRALLVGVSEYDGYSNSSLAYHEKDVRKLKGVLEYLDEGYEVETLTGHISQSEIETALTSYSSGSEEDVFLFYYGGMIANSGDYLYLSGAEFYDVNDLKSKLDNIPGKKIIIADGGTNSNLISWAADDYKVLVSDSSSYYSHLESYTFTYYLCDGLGDVSFENIGKCFDGTYDADGYNDSSKNGQITLDELYNYVYDKAANSTAAAPAYSSFVIGTISTKLPTVKKISGPVNTTYSNTTIFEWTTDCYMGSTVDHYLINLNNSEWADIGNLKGYTWAYIPEGENTFSVMAIDSEGRKSLPTNWEFTYTDISGAFKIANSWGAGISDWENVPDGFLYITEDAMRESVKKCFLYEPPSGYAPTVMAVFEISGGDRSSCDVTIKNGSKSKSLNTFLYDGADDYPFPDNKIVLDITELLPINGDLTLEVANGSGRTATIEYFAVEKYYSYPNSLTTLYDAGSSVPKTIDSKKTGSVTISGVYFNAVNERKSSLLYSASEPFSAKDLETYSNQGIECDELLTRSGNMTGLIKPSEEELQRIVDQGLMRTLNPEKILDVFRTARITSTIDHSQTKYFPPIASQGNKGSCVAFSMGYYIASFYNAKYNDWDLSEAVWENGYSGNPDEEHQEYISSPDFIFSQACGTNGSGMSYQDAIRLMTTIGISSWQNMPYTDENCEAWPSEAAWREAPLRRSDQYEGVYQLDISTTTGIEALKTLLANGYMMSISINSNRYPYMTDQDVWNSSNYPYQSSTDHANTIVGYIE